jgi:hypothetical protein
MAKSKQYAPPLELARYGGTHKQMAEEAANRIREREPPTAAQALYPNHRSTVREAISRRQEVKR